MSLNSGQRQTVYADETNNASGSSTLGIGSRKNRVVKQPGQIELLQRSILRGTYTFCEIRIDSVSGNALEDLNLVHSQDSSNLLGLLINCQLDLFAIAFNNHGAHVDRGGVDVIGVNRVREHVAVGVDNVAA